MDGFTCCANLDLEIANADGPVTQGHLCQPCPARLILRIRDLFSCTKRPRSIHNGKEAEGMDVETAYVHAPSTSPKTVQNK